jgi:DNA-directed RNA polymerase subunit K/omega
MKNDYPLAEDFARKTGNVYEVIMVLAKRARKISADQKIEIEKTLTISDTESEGEEEIQTEKKITINLEKPLNIAIREFQSDDLEFDYKEKSQA